MRIIKWRNNWTKPVLSRFKLSYLLYDKANLERINGQKTLLQVEKNNRLKFLPINICHVFC